MSHGRLVDTFLDLVRIASPSFSEAEAADYAEEILVECGCEVFRDASAARTGSDTGNLIGLLPASGDGLAIVLSAHLDTVEPAFGVEPVITDGVVSSAGATVLGADDKAGVAVILEAVRRTAESDGTHPEIRVVLTVAEEKGLVGAKELDPAAVAGDLCLVLDADGDPGGIVVGSPTHYTFKATFHGRAAHAGVQPEKGVSAIVMASTAVAAMPNGRIDDETTANVGSFEGGSATNIVAPTVDITGECRSRDVAKVEDVRRQMHEAMEAEAEAAGGRVEIAWTKEYDAVRFDEDDPLLALVEDASRDAGLEPRRFMTGGGSDGNVLAAKGVPTLVLSSGMSDVHTVDETVRIEDLERLLDFVLAVIGRAGE